MKIIRSIKLSLVLLAISSFSSFAAVKTEVKELICEYHANPIGIEVQKPRLSWQLASMAENVLQTAYEIRITDQTVKGKLIWTSGKVESDQSVNVEYGGPALASMQRVYWQVRVWDNKKNISDWSAPAFWEMGLLEPESWKASWIEIAYEPDTKGSKPCPYFRKEFAVAKTVKSARVYVTSHGLYQLFLNGQKVSSDLFTPGWTSYNKRLQYQTYDVTSLIGTKNAIGAIVGDGWFRGYLTWEIFNNFYGNKLALLVQLQINYTDGTCEQICTNQSWKVTTNGPIIESDIYNGETYNARKEMPGWVNAGFDDSQWENVIVANHSKSILVAPQGEVVKAIEEVKPVKLITTPKGEMVFDLGQNMTGWVRLRVQGKKGDQVTLRFAEVLDKDGNFYIDNLRKAEATDIYILKGEGTETFEPHFTFHGFRFVKIEGLPGQPSPDQIAGIVIHSDIKPTGSFTCSDSLINQLQHNIQWSQKDNFLDVPTDCPQRDERLGWTGDIQVFSMTGAFNFNVAAFYTKWMRDLAVDQLPSGIVPYVIPDVYPDPIRYNYSWGKGGTAVWADVAVIMPWITYLAYGDRRILEVQYPSMKAWVEYVKSRAGNNFLWIGDPQTGDWFSFATTNVLRPGYPGANTNKDLIATAYYAYSSGLLAKIAYIIDKREDAKNYTELYENVKKAFRKEFVTTSGRLVSNTQTAYSVALAFNLLPDELIPKAAAYLAEDVERMKHLTSGLVGTPILCKALSDNGYADLAFMLLNRKEYPSWLYPITKGATTIWETWDAIKTNGEVQDASFNHYAFGAIGEWMYQFIAGINIDPEIPGYKHILLSPHPGGGLTYAEAKLETLYGQLKSAWKLDGFDFVYEVTVPANTTATVLLPGAKAEQLIVNKKPITTSMKENMKQTGNGVSLNIGSGSYIFRYLSDSASC